MACAGCLGGWVNGSGHCLDLGASHLSLGPSGDFSHSGNSHPCRRHISNPARREGSVDGNAFVRPLQTLLPISLESEQR